MYHVCNKCSFCTSGWTECRSVRQKRKKTLGLVPGSGGRVFQEKQMAVLAGGKPVKVLVLVTAGIPPGWGLPSQ